MKFLWIEDFGGGLAPSKVVIDIFSNLIPEEIFDNEYDQDEDVCTELPRLFSKHTLHEIYICKSYLDWKKVYKENNGDFDIILIDINLERYKTPDSERPVEHPEFDRKAGFRIFHELIKDGVPDNNIAFLTGEENSLKFFKRICGEILMDVPKNAFEKKELDFKKLRKWIGIKMKKGKQKIQKQKMHILHISDIHLGTVADALNWYGQLADDLIFDLNCHGLDFMIISGDITNTSSIEEYKAAKQFLDNLCSKFDINASQLIIVPGNHDLNWELSKDAYTFVDKDRYDGNLIEGCFIEVADDVIRVRDEDKYKRRFINFNEFFKAVKGEPYPLEYMKQGILYHYPERNLLILGFNSAWQIDHHFTSRASIHPGAVSHALNAIRDTEAYRKCLKFAVWHHPLNSPFNDRITDHGFMERLAQCGFSVCLHGHIHKADTGQYYYDHSANGRKIHIISAGTFGAPVREWVPGYPLQYQLLELEGNELTVKTRCRREKNGAWKPDSIWPQAPGKDPLSRYKINLHDALQDRPAVIF